ncbi:MAG: hypothetical protein A3J63_02835 [Candidatus Moranbacteria bacterium RIFCSPHIGHO2_02_FULL_40_12b]|nr:MAG: hypothetical protein A3J63_02835 [Candidatus Moranbacteria bacterium RIFCSPHIGHO2_02_FULL_40_12b]
MRILVFSPYYPPHIGGLESHADEFNKYLSQRGVDITVFTPRLPKDAPESETRYENVKIIRFPAFEIISNYPLPKFWSFKFWKLFLGLFKEKYDIAISRTRFFNTSLLALIYAKIKRVKWIHIEHGSDFVKSGGKFSTAIARIYDYTFGKLILKLSDKNIANSKSSAEFCQKLAKNKKCEVIYRGIEIEKIESIPPDMETKNKYIGKTIVAFIGRLIDGKGISDLFEAIKILENKNIICLIIGNGPQVNFLKSLSEKLNINNKIKFLGYKKFNDAVGILKISDVIVNPSYTEGLPTSVIEAALCKKAIIATNVGGTPEIILGENDGFLIEPKNIETLKEKLEILVNNTGVRENFGNNAYKKVKDKFNWNNSIEKYLKIFLEILNTKY